MTDVIKIIDEIHKTRPEKHYILGIDKGKYSMKEIINKISDELGISKIRNWSEKEKEQNILESIEKCKMYQMNIEFNTSNLIVNEMEIEWLSEVRMK